ncbi:CHAT domain-containing protein [Sphingorhabdus arenilitoris]|uniref:CHAT domain-containing protein n=1 Tax=Sphingorhabdus arenilitoris TaxID=1490041 RepID=A0ABV8RFR1_9SPHN
MNATICTAFALSAICLAPYHPAFAQNGAGSTEQLVQSEGTITAEYISQQWQARDRFANPKAELEFWKSLETRLAASEKSETQEAAWIALRLAISHFYTQDYSVAAEDISNAKRLAESNDIVAPRFWAELYSYAVIIETDRPDKKAAENWLKKLDQFKQAEKFQDRYILPLALNAEAYWQFKHGDRSEALNGACQAADVAKAQLAVSDPLRHANAINCGVFAFYLDRPEAASLLEVAANDAIANLPSGHKQTGQAINVAAAVTSLFGRYREAEKLFRRQMDIELENFGTDSPNVYDPASQLAQMLALQGKIDEAIEMQRQVVVLADNLKGGGDLTQRGHSRGYLAAIMGISGKPENAISIAREGLSLLRQKFPDGHPSVSTAELELGYLLANYGDADEAIQIAEAGISKLTSQLGEGHIDLFTSRIRYAYVMAQSGRAQEAMDIGWKTGQEMLLRFSEDSVRRSNIASLSAALTSNFGVLAEIAMLAGDKAKLAQAIQIGNASDLTIANRELALRLAAEDRGLGELTDVIRQQKSKIQRLKTEIARLLTSPGYDPKQIEDLRQQSVLAEDENVAAQHRLAAEFPDYVALTNVTAAALTDIQANLDANSAVVFPTFLYGKSATVLITKDDVIWQTQPQGRPQMENALFAVSDSLGQAKNGGDFDTDAAHRLFEAIFPSELYAKLASKTNLLFPAGGVLAAIPPSLLITKPAKKGEKTAWIIRDKSVSVFTDLSKKAAASSAAVNFAGLGDPKLAPSKVRNVELASLFRGGKVDADTIAALPSLPGAGDELKQVRSALSSNNSILLTGQDFTETAVKAFDFTPYSVVSFATHGLTSGEIAGLSEPALVVTPPSHSGVEGASDGLLTASEIALLDIPADWVILSACNSGSGSNGASPQYSGLARAFRTAGAKSLLLTHWQLRDDIAAQLTVNTVTAAANGIPKAEALRQAQLALIDSGKSGADNPALWAPFILIGY